MSKPVVTQKDLNAARKAYEAALAKADSDRDIARKTAYMVFDQVHAAFHNQKKPLKVKAKVK